MRSDDMPRFLSNDELERWHNDGYLVVENLFSLDQIDLALRAIFACFKMNAPELATFGCDGPPHHSDEFHARMIKLREESPKVFSRIYDTMQTNAVINGQASCPSVLSVVGQLFGDPFETIVRSDTLMRMDPPQDSRNLVGWHQDRAGRDQNDSGFHGLVFMMPLQDTCAQNGAQKVCIGSHKEGYIDVKIMDSSEKLASQIYALPEERLEKYEPIQISANMGDGGFFSFNLFHASGLNTSDRIRLTIGMRYHRANTDDFHPGALNYIPSA